MDGGPIGGIEQRGKWKLDARYNMPELARRCSKVAEYADRIKVSKLDGVKFIADRSSEQVFFLIDPPYYVKGPKLYLNRLAHEYHERLAAQLSRMSDAAWVLTYDDCPEIRTMYEGWAHVKPYSLRYSASERRGGREILITPQWMQLPSYQASKAIQWN